MKDDGSFEEDGFTGSCEKTTIEDSGFNRTDWFDWLDEYDLSFSNCLMRFFLLGLRNSVRNPTCLKTLFFPLFF